MHAPSAAIGRRPDLAAELAQLGDPTYTAARVLAQHRGRWLVSDGSDAPPRLVAARGRMRAAGERTPTTGDWVALDADGVIAAVLERRGSVVRRAAGAPVTSQVLAANVELVLVVEPLPEPNERRCERIVALAAAGGVPAALVLTKADLDPDGGASARAMARRLGLEHGVSVSVHDPASIGPLDALLEPQTTSVLLGPSGAGKSTLVNALLGFDRQAIGAVSEHNGGRGRHTTVTRDLLTLPVGRAAHRHARHPRGRAVGGRRRRRDVRRHRGARRPVSLLQLPAQRRAGLRGERGGRPRAGRGLAQARARAEVDRRPPRGDAGARAARPQLQPHPARGAAGEDRALTCAYAYGPPMPACRRSRQTTQ